MRQIFFLFFFSLLVLGGAAARVLDYMEDRAVLRAQRDAVVPPAQTWTDERTDDSDFSGSQDLPLAVNWSVPFTSQAPLGMWTEDHKEACEEASVLMVVRYFQGKGFASPEDADDAVLHLVRLNEEELGYPVDQTVEQVAELLHLVLPGISSRILRDPTEDDMKRALAQGSLLILPAAGRQLRNPYFQTPGPLYHMLVLRGYTEDGYAITNDPGTRNGEGFLYRWNVLLDALHDWNDGDVYNGEKVALVVGP